MAGGFTSTPEARRHHIRQYGSLTANNGLGESPSSVNERKRLFSTVISSHRKDGSRIEPLCTKQAAVRIGKCYVLHSLSLRE